MRLKYDHIQLFKGKRYVNPKDEPKLFKCKNLVIEEKIDGSQSGVGFKGGYPYAQGRSGHISEFDKRVAFVGFWSWIWQKVVKIEKVRGHLLFGEWMKPQHSIEYDELPDFFIAFDVWAMKQKQFLNLKAKTKFLEEVGIAQIPLLYEGKIKKDDIPDLVDNKKSNYSSNQNMEGCVIKDYDSQMMCKYVCREFLEEMFDDSGHWTSRSKVKYNRLKEWNR